MMITHTKSESKVDPLFLLSKPLFFIEPAGERGKLFFESVARRYLLAVLSVAVIADLAPAAVAVIAAAFAAIVMVVASVTAFAAVVASAFRLVRLAFFLAFFPLGVLGGEIGRAHV